MTETARVGDVSPEEKTKRYDIEQLMREYGNDVLRIAHSYVKDIHTAEDLFQETFIKAYRHIESFHNESSIKTWLLRIAINTCKDYLKSAYSRHVVPMMDFAEEALVSEDDYEEVEQQDTNEQIKEAVMSLPEKYREVVMCVFYKEMSMQEAAGVLGIPEGTVKSRLLRAKDRLRVVLQNGGKYEIG